MNRYYGIKKYLLIISIIAMGFLIASCDVKEDEEIPKTVEVELDKTTMTMEKYEIAEFSATIKNGDVGDTVVWSVENDQTISFEVDGNSVKVYAKNAGTAVLKASFDDVTAQANILVIDDGVVPTIYSEHDKFDILVDHDFKLQFQISFMAELHNDAEYTYSIADESVAVVENGVLKGISKGDTTLTVTATWREVDDEILRLSIPVSIKTDAALYFTTEKIELYTAEVGEYVNQISVPVVAVVNGIELTNIDIDFEVEDDSIVEVIKVGEEYFISAKNQGSTRIMATLAHDGEEFQTDYLQVDVVFPVLDLTNVGSTQISLLDLTISELKTSFDLEDIVSVFDVTATRNELNIVDDMIDAPKTYYGEKLIEINSSSFGVKIVANVYTKIIKTPTDLNHMLEHAKVSDKVFDGYFVLGNDIDFNGLTYTPTDNSLGWVENDGHGFMGIFDGQGYAIKNITIKNGGLISSLGVTGVIKNVALLGVNLEQTGNHQGLIGRTSREGAQIENIYIEINSSNGGNEVALYSVAYGLRINHIIVYAKENAPMNSAITFDYYGDNGLRVQNIIVISENEVTATNTQGKNYDNLKLHSTVLDFVDANHNWNELGFGEFKFAENIEFDKDVALNVGENINLFDLLGTKFIQVDLSSLPEHVTYSNGILTATSGAEAFDGTFQIQYALPGGLPKPMHLEIIEVGDLGHFEFNENTSETLEIDGFVDIPIKLEINGYEITYTFEDNKLVLSPSDLALLPNDVMLNGSLVTSDKTYLFTLEIIRSMSMDLVTEVTLDSFDLDETTETDWQIDAVLMNGTTEVPSGFTYESLNPEIASVSSTGLVSALKSGTAVIKVTSVEAPEIFAQVTVTVKLVVDNQTADDRKDIEAYGTLTDVLNTLGMPADDEVLSIIDITDPQNQLTAVLNGNLITGLPTGERVWQVNGGRLAIQANVLFVTKIIKTTTDLNQFLAVAKVSDKVYDGYFVLGNDIDYNGSAYTPTDNTLGFIDNDAHGFLGILDGRGYAIKNVTINNNGLISSLGITGIVRNISFINVNLNQSGNNQGLIGRTSREGAQLSDIYVDITTAPGGNIVGLYAVAYGLRVNRVIVNIGANAALNSAVTLNYFGDDAARIQNVFVISENEVTATNTQGKNYTNVGIYETVQELVGANIDWEEAGFSSYWNFDQDLPYLANS